jgi:hypothetical protein
MGFWRIQSTTNISFHTNLQMEFKWIRLSLDYSIVCFEIHNMNFSLICAHKVSFFWGWVKIGVYRLSEIAVKNF